MNKWTDKHIKKHIEDLIEESYILSLDTADLGRHIHGFIQASEAVLLRGTHGASEIKITRLKIALLRARLLENDIRTATCRELKAENPFDQNSATLQEKTIRTKRMIRMLLGDIDQHLATQVILESKRRADLAAGRSQRTEKIKTLAVGAGYYILLAMTLILFWIVISY